MTEAMGLGRLENAVRANLADAERVERLLRERLALTPWWQWDLRRARGKTATLYFGMVKGYRVVLELIEWTRIRDARAQSEAKGS